MTLFYWSIGSIGGDPNDKGVRNATIKNTSFEGTKNGVRIKTWAKPVNAVIQNITFQNATMKNVNNPIIIDQNYCPEHNNPSCGNQVNIINQTTIFYFLIKFFLKFYDSNYWIYWVGKREWRVFPKSHIG